MAFAASGNQYKMINPDLLKKIKRIHITSRRTVDAVMAGHYRSTFRGSGVEFEEVREYSPGDEVKSIDWKVTARMGRPFVKLFREERELTVMLLVDVSASGGFGTTGTLKRETAAESAAILAVSAVQNGDKVGAVLFSDRMEKYVPPKKGSSHVWRVIREILGTQPESRGTDLAAGTDFLAKMIRKKCVTFLISDFLSEGWPGSVRRAAGRHDLIAVMVTDPGDYHLPRAGILEAEDLETGRRIFLDCSDRRTREAFQDARHRLHDTTLAELKRAKIDCIEVQTGESAADAFYSFFRAREKRFR